LVRTRLRFTISPMVQFTGAQVQTRGRPPLMTEPVLTLSMKWRYCQCLLTCYHEFGDDNHCCDLFWNDPVYYIKSFLSDLVGLGRTCHLCTMISFIQPQPPARPFPTSQSAPSFASPPPHPSPPSQDPEQRRLLRQRGRRELAV